MDLSLISIEVEAFKNFAARTVLRLGDVPPGLHLVRGVNRTNDRLGSNGAGKSSLLSDAVTWCLYGRTVGGLRTTDVHSWLTKKPPRVALTLEAGGERVVQRGPRATELTIDGKSAGQEDVDALVGVGFSALTQAVVWGQGQPLFFDLAPRDKMGLLSDALGLEKWERFAEAARIRARALEQQAADLEGELRGLEVAQEDADRELVAARAEADAWGREHGERLRAAEARAKKALRARDAAEQQLGEASLSTDGAGSTARDVRASAEALQVELAGQQAEARERAGLLGTARADLGEAEEQLVVFSEEGRCPMCGQAVKKKNADDHIRALRARVKKLTAAIREMERATDGAARQTADTEGLLGELRARVRDLEADEARSSSELRMREHQASDARARLAAAEEALRGVEAEANPHRETATRARRRLREIKRDVAGADAELARCAASAERAQFWARGFRDIRLSLIDEALGDLRATTAGVLEDLGLGEWRIDYATERETRAGATQRALTVSVISPTSSGAVRWEAYSGGERQRLRLAGALALGEVLLGCAGVGVDFRVLDEPTRGMSPEGVRDLTEMLATYAEEAGIRVFYVDHQSTEGLAFSSTITIVNEPDGARVVGE